MIDYAVACQKGFLIQGLRRLPLHRRPKHSECWITWLEASTIGCLHLRVKYQLIQELTVEVAERVQAQADLAATWIVGSDGVITCQAAWAYAQAVEPLGRILVSDFVRESIEALWRAKDGETQEGDLV